MKIRLDFIKFCVSGYVDNVSVHPVVIEKLECFLSELVSKKEILDYNVLTLSNKVSIILLSDAERFKEKGDVDSIVYGAIENLEKCECSFAFEKDTLKQFRNFSFTERKNESILIFFATNIDVKLHNMRILNLLFDPFSKVKDFLSNSDLVFTINLKFGAQAKSYNQFEELFKLAEEIKRTGSDFYIESVLYQNSQPLMASLEDSSVSVWRVSKPYYPLNFVLDILSRDILPVTFYDTSNVFNFPKSLAIGFSVQNGKLYGPLDLFDNSFYDYLRTKFYERNYENYKYRR